MKILLTAFEPFDGRSINASWEAAHALRNHRFEGATLKILGLPVERFKATAMALEAIARIQPDIAIMLGEAGGRAVVTPERVAINIDDFPIPDNAGMQPREEPVVEGGPTAYFSTLPITPIVEALLRARIPAEISNTAGTYLCNHLFYGVRHQLEEMKSPIRVGFMHVPLLPEQKPKGSKEWPCLPRKTAVEAVRIAVEVCITNQAAVTR